MERLTVEKIVKHYDGDPLLNGLSLAVSDGEILCLLGRSGSGKSTLLRIITGLESADAGQVLWDGADIAALPTHLRRFGLMFQDYALFPHRSVAENVAFGLEMQRLSKTEITQQVAQALEKVNMGAFAQRSVAELSGGEQQRVALARSLAARPRLLLLDEPLAALDRSLRLELQVELRELLHQAGIPVIYVTHDQEEAVFLGDRLAILHEGRILQEGTPQQVYSAPVNRWVAEFLGMENFVAGTVAAQQPLRVQTRIGELVAESPTAAQFPAGKEVWLALRPDHAALAAGGAAQNLVSGKVLDCRFREDGYLATLDCGGGQVLRFLLPQPARTGEKLTLQLSTTAVILIPA
jgi:ABC-type Fe3+/spermidine/putrescine transport system ATPase subunit